MFSKSKRFPEGRRFQKSTQKKTFFNNNHNSSTIKFPPRVYFAVGKEYIPGPGEYEVFVDDIVKHKRYGFISQTSRFPDNLDVSYPNEVFDEPTSTTSLSTDTRLSSTSSNRTLDESSRSRKSSLTSDNTFEKYRFTMQKEIEALQSRGRKMEATIQSMEDSKNAVKTQLLEKDQELADMRAKNNALQKTVTRLEKSFKITHLTKKLETVQDKLRSTQDQYQVQLTEKDSVIQGLEEQLKTTIDTVADVEMVSNTRQTEINTLKKQLESTTEHWTALQDKVMTQQNHIASLETELENVNQALADTREEHHQITSDYAERLNQVTAELEREKMTTVSLRDALASSSRKCDDLEREKVEQQQEIEHVLSQKSQREQMIQHCTSLITSLQQQFKTYRSFMNGVVTDLRTKCENKCHTHVDELNALMSELNEAKRFINKQAQQMDQLKSEQYWLTKRNEQLWKTVQEMDRDFQGRKKTEKITDHHEIKETALIDSGIGLIGDS
ncbi:hypothetical protein K501DRAFT_311259 [Backusella circina FSU 941]|nr:hypothetical protein K501DRAFT_311259 [Backusella circina FSU 941]